jgi:hypothetical protein
MHNPLALLTPALVTALMDDGFTLFVRQSYEAAREPDEPTVKELFLITPYRNIGEANQHFTHIRFDHRKYIYQTHHQEEVSKLYTAASQPTGYKVYVALLKEQEWTPPLYMDPAVRIYISRKTSWRPKRPEEVGAELFLRYGILTFRLTYGDEEITVPLSELDND